MDQSSAFSFQGLEMGAGVVCVCVGRGQHAKNKKFYVVYAIKHHWIYSETSLKVH